MNKSNSRNVQQRGDQQNHQRMNRRDRKKQQREMISKMDMLKLQQAFGHKILVQNEEKIKRQGIDQIKQQPLRKQFQKEEIQRPNRERDYCYRRGRGGRREDREKHINHFADFQHQKSNEKEQQSQKRPNYAQGYNVEQENGPRKRNGRRRQKEQKQIYQRYKKQENYQKPERIVYKERRNRQRQQEGGVDIEKQNRNNKNFDNQNLGQQAENVIQKIEQGEDQTRDIRKRRGKQEDYRVRGNRQQKLQEKQKRRKERQQKREQKYKDRFQKKNNSSLANSEQKSENNSKLDIFNKDKTKELPECVLCPITQILMISPFLLTTCGHTFEEELIRQWLKKQNKCPLCNKVANEQNLIKNFALAEVCRLFSSQ